MNGQSPTIYRSRKPPPAAIVQRTTADDATRSASARTEHVFDERLYPEHVFDDHFQNDPRFQPTRPQFRISRVQGHPRMICCHLGLAGSAYPLGRVWGGGSPR